MSALPHDPELDHPLYGDFEDYLDGTLAEARRQEVEALLARSAPARALLDELQTARRWMQGTTWDVAEPTEWASPESILVRAGRRPATMPVVRPSWADWWANWRMRFQTSAWAFGVAVGGLLLAGIGFWWFLGPSATDDIARSSTPLAEERAVPPSERLDAPPVPASPDERQEVPLLRKDEKAAPPAKSSPAAPPAGASEAPPSAGVKPTESMSKPLPMVPAPGRPEMSAPSSAVPRAATPTESAPAGRGQADGEQVRREESGAVASGVAVAKPEVPPDDVAKRDTSESKKVNESFAARQRSPAGDTSSVSTQTFSLRVMDRAAALARIANLAREFGGSARRSGERVMVTVPASRVADCAARIRVQIANEANGQLLQVTVRAGE